MRQRMLEEARTLIGNSYSPYSGFRVAAVLEDTDGEMHTGVNVENGSFGISICAERSALFAAISAGSRSFRRMLIYSPDGAPLPCGACRQALWEFCNSDFILLIADPQGHISSYTLGELLPESFELPLVDADN